MDPKLCKAFGNTERLQLMLCLAKPQCVSDLLAKCSLSQSALSQHLKVLRDARVVRSHRKGQRIEYTIRAEALSIARQLLAFKK